MSVNSKQVQVVPVTLTPALVVTITTAAQSFTVPGARLGDGVTVSPPSHVAGVAPCACFVTAADTVSVVFVNPTAGSVTPPAGVYIFTFCRV